MMHECIHVSDVGLTNAKDLEIWEYARTHAFCIVSFDADFLDLSVLKGFPPKLILVRTGNRRTEQIARLLLKNVDVITEFLTGDAGESAGCLEIID